MVGSERSVLHGNRGFCSDAGSGLLGQTPAELREQQLHGGQLLEHDARRQSRRTLLEQLFERDLQTLGDEGDEDVRFDALFGLMMDWAAPASI